MVILHYPYKINMSVNQMYYYSRGSTGIKHLKKEAKILRAKIMEDTLKQMENNPFSRGDLLEVYINFYEDWFTLNDEIKKKDIDNRLKFIIDSIFMCYDLDDSQIFRLIVEKVQSIESPSTNVIINRMGVENG